MQFPNRKLLRSFIVNYNIGKEKVKELKDNDLAVCRT